MPRNGKLVRITLALAAVAARRSPRGGYAPARRPPRARSAPRERRGQHVRRAARARSGSGPVQSAARDSQLNYSAVGSGGGVAAITSRTVDFGASDAPLRRQFTDLHGVRSDPLGARGDRASSTTCPARRTSEHDRAGAREDLPGQDHEVERPGDQEAQPGHEPARARRSRSSTALTARARRTTSPTTSRRVSQTWKRRSAQAPRSTGRPATGGRTAPASPASSGRRPARSATPTSYYAVQNHLQYFRMKNRSGHFVRPLLTGTLAAAQLDTHPAKDGSLSIVNPPKSRKYRNAYPISTYTYVVVAEVERAKAADAQEARQLGDHEGTEVRAEALLRADPAASRDVRQEADQEDPLVGENRRADREHSRCNQPTQPAAPSRGGGRVWATSSSRGPPASRPSARSSSSA